MQIIPAARADAAQEMQCHPISLKFIRNHAHLENKFLRHYTKASLPLVRVGLLSGALLYAVFGILDYYLLPFEKHLTWMIRFLMVCPYLIAIAGFSYFKTYLKLMQPLLASAGVIGGLGIIIMIIIAPPPVNYSYYAGLILIFIYIYTYIRLRFLWASLTGWVIVGLYQIASIGFSDMPAIFIINNNFFFISANIIGMMACYFIEQTARQNFFMARLLNEEKEKVIQANADLEEKVAERTRKLSEANQELTAEILERKKAQEEQIRLEEKLRQVEKMEAIGTLAGGIAHDFNNILTVINGHAEISLIKTTESDPFHGTFQHIYDAGKRAEKLTGQLLAFSRKQIYQLKVIDINETISDLDKMLRRLIPEDIRINLDFEENLPPVKADPGQIEQILINLIVNARDAINAKTQDRNRREITVCTKLNTLTDHFTEIDHESPQGQYIVLSVSDSGVGMDDSIKKRVFEPFFTTKDVDKGTGLGLATVYGIVKQNRGNIVLHSQPGQGTTFSIYWPVTSESLPSADQQLPETNKLRGNEHILFVEDDEDVRNLFCMALKEFGYNVHEATNGQVALKLMEETNTPVDLLITDLIMPEVNGVELVARLESLGTIKKSLYVSGYPKDYFDQNHIDITKINFLKKPFTIPILLKKIRAILDSDLV